MEFHRGRLFDHVHIQVKDLEASRRFYRAVMEVFGLTLQREGPTFFNTDEFYVTSEGTPSRIHLALQAPDRETVHRFHQVALAAGGRDNGAPGERKYHPGYYAAFVLDPDGNNIETVFHGPAERSAPSVVLRAL
ncbi:VOC family protein [Corallococcus sp. H22C18031201]|uniref:VOC family protein n=1 Tax=Citreicoccus inhibens TaxID=2849499 RepID=UPI000E747BF3|nr:VOC family protein [Citreicoccus inhibens]RJS20884.1 VOC family protein [Corallococcus sp. H22C18031201]